MTFNWPFYLLCAVICGLVASTTLTAAQSKEAEVYAYCQNSRMNVDGYTEDLCQAKQWLHGVSYACQAKNDLPSNTCWIMNKERRI